MAAAAPIVVSMDGRVVHKQKEDKDWKATWADRATRKKYAPNDPRRLFTGDKDAVVAVRHSNVDNDELGEGDVYASNIAKIKVPTQLDPVTAMGNADAFRLYNQMDYGARIFMQLCRANTRMGAAITMITTYSRGRTNALLQLITIPMERCYNWTARETPAKSVPMAILNLNKEFETGAGDFVRILEQLYEATLSIPGVIRFTNETNTPAPIDQYLNPFYERLVPEGTMLTFKPISQPPPYRHRHKNTDRTAAYLNEPFFMGTDDPYKYVANPKYLSQHKKPFMMVRKGLGLLATALQHFWNAGFLYAQLYRNELSKPSSPDDDTFNRLTAPYKNMAYASAIMTLSTPPFGDKLQPLNAADLRSRTRARIVTTVKDFYYALNIERSGKDYPLTALSIRLLNMFNEHLHTQSAAQKRAYAKIIMKRSDHFANSTHNFAATIERAITSGKYTAIPVTITGVAPAPSAATAGQ